MKAIQEMTKAEAEGIRFVLMDIDDTLTREGKLLASAYQALWNLREAGLRVIPVTGRPAGWCDLIAREWPVDGVIGENGALAFWEEPQEGRLPRLRQEFFPGAVRNDHPVLEEIREAALKAVPGLRVAKDQFARMFDLALDFAEEDPVLTLDDAEKVREIAEARGAMAKVSSIHVNVWMGSYDKLSMAESFLKKRFGWQPETDSAQVIFCGDSPNDEPMFRRFPLAAGVANVKRYEKLITHLPAFVSSKECGHGFAEIAGVILEKRG
ncbi:HAD-IIB family hydrolase [Breznakiella homolactica]|uniref:HAD-IIB family hydrolase n=1 Tax=Breznakiella homolactica TaxID=2798577 RepID=A0A7T7XP52_9SPIR|nr:HAD-IIB family hydrolase [Breznakiella homolactica]QQO09911.1 HAD-IIB family hydrolase [Breznakiella homolactica]